jgi:hypothetical protein
MNAARLYSFIMRVWQAGDGERPQWRASLENTQTGERRGFASLEDLATFIQTLPGEKAGNQQTQRSNIK